MKSKQMSNKDVLALRSCSKLKLSNKVISAFYSHSKSSFTLSKLRFFVLRKP